MNDEQKSIPISSLFNFSKYSITTIHILIELVCFLVIFLYIRRNVRKLQNQIDDLTTIIQQQQEMLHTHNKLLMNNTPIITITETDNLSDIFNIPLQNNTPPPSQTIIEKQQEEAEVIPPPPLTEEAIEQELVEEMQELKQDLVKDDDEKKIHNNI